MNTDDESTFTDDSDEEEINERIHIMVDVDFYNGHVNRVRLPERLRRENALMQADVLKDVLYELTKQYNWAVEHLHTKT